MNTAAHDELDDGHPFATPLNLNVDDELLSVYTPEAYSGPHVDLDELFGTPQNLNVDDELLPFYTPEDDLMVDWLHSEFWNIQPGSPYDQEWPYTGAESALQAAVEPPILGSRWSRAGSPAHDTDEAVVDYQSNAFVSAAVSWNQSGEAWSPPLPGHSVDLPEPLESASQQHGAANLPLSRSAVNVARALLIIVSSHRPDAQAGSGALGASSSDSDNNVGEPAIVADVDLAPFEALRGGEGSPAEVLSSTGTGRGGGRTHTVEYYVKEEVEDGSLPADDVAEETSGHKGCN